MPVEIVSLRPDEWSLYRAIRLEALQVEPQAFGSTYANTLELPDEEWESRLRSDRNLVRFAKVDGESVGLAGIALELEKNSASIFSAYVRPSHRRRGIAKLLMESLLKIVKEYAQIEKVVLCVHATESPAIALYRSCGFVETRRFASVRGENPCCDVVLMELPAGNL